MLNKPCPVIPIVAEAGYEQEAGEQAQEGPPTSFQWQNCRYHITRAWGPERIETGWWRGETVRRDYYRIEIASGARFWLFQRLSDGCWFLHGGFD